MNRFHVFTACILGAWIVAECWSPATALGSEGNRRLGRLRTNDSPARSVPRRLGRLARPATAQERLMQRRGERVSRFRDRLAREPGTTRAFRFGDRELIVTEGHLSGGQVRALGDGPAAHGDHPGGAIIGRQRQRSHFIYHSPPLRHPPGLLPSLPLSPRYGGQGFHRSLHRSRGAFFGRSSHQGFVRARSRGGFRSGGGHGGFHVSVHGGFSSRW